MSESSNITIRLGINGGTDSPLTYEQLDTNFLELKSVIDDYNDHINSENPHDAIFIYYDNENSSLSSSDIQSALDEVDANVVNMQNQITTKLDKTSFEDHIDSNTAHNAVDIVYDNSNSTIQQDDVNAAIDQLDANYNANDVLNKIKSVDGSGSGLDADTLDGIDSLGFDAAGAADTAVSDHEATNDHPLATTSAKGFLSGADKTKIDTVESGATADQTDAEIKIAYESNADTNEFSDAEQTKLLGIEDGATADQTKADIDALNIDADTLDGINSLGFDAAGAADTAVSDHVALADPHAQYAGLDGGASANFTTMPQVGGDPIVESGSNADGEWTRWADGTQITHLISGTLTASDELISGSGLYSSDISVGYFPRAFDVIPVSALGARGTSGAGLSGTVGWASAREKDGSLNTTTRVEVGFTSTEQNATALVWVVSIGRWK